MIVTPIRGFCNCSIFVVRYYIYIYIYIYIYVHSRFAITFMGKRELVALLMCVFLVSPYSCVALPHGAMGLSAVCDCFFLSYSLTILEMFTRW